MFDNNFRSAMLFFILIINSLFADSLVPVKINQINIQPNLIKISTKNAGIPLPNTLIILETLTGQITAKGLTDVDGIFSAEISPQDFIDGINITASKSGYSTLSLLANMGNEINFDLPLIRPDEYAVLQGTLTGYDTATAGRLKCGIVTKALDFSDLAHLDSSTFISPIMDSIQILTKIEFPSNLTLPDQWFNYGSIPIHVVKPNFRLPALLGSNQKFIALTGNGDAKKIADAVNAKKFNEVFNQINLTHLGVNSQNTTQSKTLNMNANILINGVQNLKANVLTPQPANFIHGVSALYEFEPGLFAPTDLKEAKLNTQLHVVAGKTQKFLDVISNLNGDQFRIEWIDNTKSEIPNSKISADFSVSLKGYAGPWNVSMSEPYSLILAKSQNTSKTSIGGYRIDDRWIVIAPARSEVAIPQAAYAELANSVGNINTLSLDLIQTASGGYPYVDGDAITKNHKIISKVIKNIATK